MTPVHGLSSGSPLLLPDGLRRRGGSGHPDPDFELLRQQRNAVTNRQKIR